MPRGLIEPLARRPRLTAAALFALFVLVYLWPALRRRQDALAAVVAVRLRAVAGTDSAATWPTTPIRCCADVPQADYPWRFLARALIRDGTFPAWNPHVFAGIPFFANPQAMILSPFSLPLWVLPLHYAVGVAAALTLWTAAFGTFLLVRELGLALPAGAARRRRVCALLVPRRVAHARLAAGRLGAAAVDAVAHRADRAARRSGAALGLGARDGGRRHRRPSGHATAHTRRGRALCGAAGRDRHGRAAHGAVAAARARRRRARRRRAARRRDVRARAAVLARHARHPGAPRRRRTARHAHAARRARVDAASRTGGVGRARSAITGPVAHPQPGVRGRSDVQRAHLLRWRRRAAAGASSRSSRASAGAARLPFVVLGALGARDPAARARPLPARRASARRSSSCRTSACTSSSSWRSRCSPRSGSMRCSPERAGRRALLAPLLGVLAALARRARAGAESGGRARGRAPLRERGRRGAADDRARR